MMKTMGHNLQAGISAVRLIATILIITCHVFQYLSIELAWWFNVGVQIFFCVSGYLYGQKEKEEPTGFYKRRFKKILVPYYLVFIFFGLLLLLFRRESFSGIRFLGGLICRMRISGGEHLWFVPYILLCYCFTPILHAYRDRYCNSNRKWWILSIFSVAIVSVFFGLFDRFFNPAWMSCYVIGYFLGVNERKEDVSGTILIILFGFLSMIGNGIQICCDYVYNISFSGKIELAYNYFSNYNHVWLGVFVFLLLKMIFDRVEFSRNIKQFLNISDKYSYETYLVHQFFILGPFSLMSLTPYVGLNIFIIIICIGISAWILKQVETMVLKVIP